jgi:hypothetical protein
MTAHNTKARSHSTFKAIRKQLLEHDNHCAICGNEANTIDHIRPVDTFTNPIDANTLDNCRVLCRSCNSRAGARYVNAKTAGKLADIADQEPTPKPKTHYKTPPAKTNTRLTTQSETEFLDTTGFLPPKESISVSFPNTPREWQNATEFLSESPRLCTNTESGNRVLLGDLASFARDVLNVELMDWQLKVLGDQLSLFPDDHPDAGRMMFSRSLVSVARQNGKSFALKVLVMWWLVRMPMLRGTPQTVLTTAHRLDLASELFNATAPILQEKFGAKLVQSYGRQGLTMPDGTRWLVRAATPSAGMGLSCDLVVIDELYDCSTLAVDDALIPTMRARRDPLLSCWSTAGTEESHVMKRMRERGMSEIAVGTKSKMYFAEYSPPSNIDPMTPEAWKYANPALGTLLEMSTIEEESHSPNTASFLRASCNLWITGHKSWLDIGLMENNADACNLPPNGVLAIEASQEDHRFVGVRAVTKGDQVLVTVEFIVDNLRELWTSVDQCRKENPKLTLAIGASLDLHLPSNIRGNAILVGTRELQRWTTLVRSMIQSGQVRHTGESIFIEQMNRAVLVKHNGIMAISSSRSPGPIELVRAAVWAIAQEGKPKVTKTVSYAFSE